MLFTILSSYFFIEYDMFQQNWPSSGVQVVKVKEPVAHCNALSFPLVILVMWVAISFILVSLGCTWLRFCNV
jgi:uncharacterized protein with PQ loop repeat